MWFFGNLHSTMYNIKIQMTMIYCENIVTINTERSYELLFLTTCKNFTN